MCIIGITQINFSKEKNLKKEISEVDNKFFSMFIETANGYEEYRDSTKFPAGYKINLEESKCLDSEGNVIEGILSVNGTKIIVKPTTTSYCYLYFDQDKSVYGKLVSDYTNNLECENKNDRFTLKTTMGGTEGYGNNALDYPIGLMSYYEANLARGGTSPNHITSGQNYWLFSP